LPLKAANALLNNFSACNAITVNQDCLSLGDNSKKRYSAPTGCAGIIVFHPICGTEPFLSVAMSRG